jgi:O-antigen/teichoic acid export membrane protein
MLPEKFSHGKHVVLFIGLAQLFNVTTGVNGLIIIYSKYYRFNMFSNILLLIITIAFNYILIPKYGINGAAVATSISVFLFYTIKMIFVYVKMGMHPFNIKTLYTIILLFSTLFIVGYMPITSNIFIDIILRSLLVLILFVPLMLWLKLSEDINKIIVDVRKQFGL